MKGLIDIVKNGRRFKKLATALAVLIAVVLVLIIAVNFVAEIIEIKEIGYESIYFKNMSTKLAIWSASFAFLFVLFYINLLFVRRITRKTSAADVLSKKKFLPAILAAVMAAVAGSIACTKIYPHYLPFYSSVDFNQVDPIFLQDVGYYIFKRPFLTAVCRAFGNVMLFQAVYTAAAYLFCYLRSDIYSYKEMFKEKSIMTHLITNIIIYFVIIAVSFKFTSENILYGTFGGLNGAGFTDVFVWHNVYKVAPIGMILVVVLTIIFITKGKIKGAVISVLIVPAVWILTLAASLVVQLAFVKPYEVSMQSQYIGFNIDATRRAFALNNVEEREYPADDDLTYEDIRANASTVDNIRILDITQTLTATNSIQGLRTFYTFTDTDIINLEISGKKTAVMVATREFDADKLPDSAKSYINKRLRYTHGYGIVANPVNTATEEGQPEYLIKDIPVYSEEGAPQITQPRIYYGEMTNDYVIVGSTYKELDYMEGDSSAEFTYEGSGGIGLNFLNRVIFSVKEADPMMLMSGYITSDSRMLTNRNILNRVRKVMPFLTFDNDPYIVIDSDGSIKWVIDAYTTSNQFPYSQTYKGINYIRNSAKAIVDPYNGTVDFYITDPSDPLIAVYSRMYPGVFKEGLPQYLASQMRYPEYIFNIQSDVYKMYHMSEPEAFYSKSDVWVTAKEKYMSGDTVNVSPYYNLMRVDEMGGEELVLMQPYTPQGKENLVAWIAARCDTANYGKMIAYKFPKGRTVYGTLHIENKIDNDPAISKEISLWDQGGSSVVKGNLLVIPIHDSLLYVEPVYITAQNSAALPEVKRIVVAFGDKVTMQPTLREALEVIFANKSPAEHRTEEEKTVEELIDETIEKYNEMRAYSESGQFKQFGKALDDIGKLLGEIEEKQAEENPTEQEEDLPKEKTEE